MALSKEDRLFLEEAAVIRSHAMFKIYRETVRQITDAPRKVHEILKSHYRKIEAVAFPDAQPENEGRKRAPRKRPQPITPKFEGSNVVPLFKPRP